MVWAQLWKHWTWGRNLHQRSVIIGGLKVQHLTKQCCRCRCSLIVLCCDTLFKCLSVDECFWPIVTDCTCPGWAETVTQVRNINSVITWIKLSLIQHSAFCLLTMVFLQDSKSLVSADQTRSYYFCRLSVTKVGLDFVTILNRILKLNF